ncbi:MAG: hypothetical protein VXZ55_03660, partial [Planctomycetota bacterium]|nr:hypothetical protein [Planctomycetota bacterium]
MLNLHQRLEKTGFLPSSKDPATDAFAEFVLTSREDRGIQSASQMLFMPSHDKVNSVQTFSEYRAEWSPRLHHPLPS